MQGEPSYDHRNAWLRLKGSVEHWLMWADSAFLPRNSSLYTFQGAVGSRLCTEWRFLRLSSSSSSSSPFVFFLFFFLRGISKIKSVSKALICPDELRMDQPGQKTEKVMQPLKAVTCWFSLWRNCTQLHDIQYGCSFIELFCQDCKVPLWIPSGVCV